MSMYHPHVLCATCWTERNPDYPARDNPKLEPETCCACGGVARGAIYVRDRIDSPEYPRCTERLTDEDEDMAKLEALEARNAVSPLEPLVSPLIEQGMPEITTREGDILIDFTQPVGHRVKLQAKVTLSRADVGIGVCDFQAEDEKLGISIRGTLVLTDDLFEHTPADRMEFPIMVELP